MLSFILSFAHSSEVLKNENEPNLIVRALSEELKPIELVTVEIQCEGLDPVTHQKIGPDSKVTGERGFAYFSIKMPTACSISCKIKEALHARVIADIEQQQSYLIEMVLIGISTGSDLNSE